MTRKELSDNLSFLSALKMLERLAADGLLTEQERKRRGRTGAAAPPHPFIRLISPLGLQVLLPRFPICFSLVLVNGYCGETVVLCVAERRSKKI